MNDGILIFFVTILPVWMTAIIGKSKKWCFRNILFITAAVVLSSIGLVGTIVTLMFHELWITIAAVLWAMALEGFVLRVAIH